MRTKHGTWPLWGLPALEAELDGTTPTRLGALRCEAEETPRRVRFGVCGSDGAAGRLEYRLKWQKCGWELLCERGRLCAFGAAEGTEMPADDGLEQLFFRRIRRLETVRIVMLLLTAAALIAGYAAEGFALVRLAAIPLAAALLLTLAAEKLKKARKQLSNRE